MKHDLTILPVISVTVSDGVVESMKQGHMEADGTHYSMTVIPVGKDYGDRFLGSVDGDGYLVINGINRQAYLFRKTGYLDPSYVAEKLGQGLTNCDMENVIHLLSKLIPTRTAPEYEAE